jgi:hypothetical protein
MKRGIFDTMDSYPQVKLSEKHIRCVAYQLNKVHSYPMENTA